MGDRFIVDVVTIIALFVGPWAAHYRHATHAEKHEKRRRKFDVFANLMATRATKLSQRHVEALNAIELELSSKGSADKRVFDAWRIYLDHLNIVIPAEDENGLKRWGEKGTDLLVDLLYQMSLALGYESDKVSLKNSVYFPRAHGEMDTDQMLTRKFLLDVMAGKRALWSGVFTGDRPLQMEIVNLPKPPAISPTAMEVVPNIDDAPAG